MDIISSDAKRNVELGSSDTLYSLFSTVSARLVYLAKEIPLAMKFLQSGKCKAKNGIETARQFNLIRDGLAKFPPQDAIYDLQNPGREAPWANNLSPVVTSCANLYTTADGKDLLFEIVSILTYGGIVGVDVVIQ